MQHKATQRSIALLSLLVLAVAGFLISLVSSQEAEALPGQDVTHVYYYDKEHTQYAGEEWVMTCNGAPPGGGIMIDGVRANYHVSIADPCDDNGKQKRSCRKCMWLNGYPVNPICNEPPGKGLTVMCPNTKP